MKKEIPALIRLIYYLHLKKRNTHGTMSVKDQEVLDEYDYMCSVAENHYGHDWDSKILMKIIINTLIADNL